jgi:hypothetical protein
LHATTLGFLWMDFFVFSLDDYYIICNMSEMHEYRLLWRKVEFFVQFKQYNFRKKNLLPLMNPPKCSSYVYLNPKNFWNWKEVDLIIAVGFFTSNKLDFHVQGRIVYPILFQLTLYLAHCYSNSCIELFWHRYVQEK